MSFVYNKAKGAWYRDDGTRVNPGNRVKTSNGIYYLLNSDGTRTKVGTVSSGLDKDFAAHLKKRGLNIDLENKAMRAGLVKDKVYNKWRLDSITDSANARTTTDGRSYFKGADGLWYNFDNGLRRDLDIKILELKATKSANKKMGIKPTDNWTERFKLNGIISGIVDGLMDYAKVDENSGWRTAADLGASFIYNIPIVGTALSLADAGIAASLGNWGDAALTLGMGLIPGGKTAKKFVQGSKLFRATNKLLPKLYKRLTGAQKAFRDNLLSKGYAKEYATQEARLKAPKTIEALNKNSNGLLWLKDYRTQGIGKFKRTYGDKEAKIRNFVSTPLILGGGISMLGKGINDSITYDLYKNQYMEEDAKNNKAGLNSSLSFGRIGKNIKGDDFIGFKDFTNQEMDENTWNQLRNAAAYGYLEQS